MKVAQLAKIRQPHLPREIRAYRASTLIQARGMHPVCCRWGASTHVYRRAHSRTSTRAGKIHLFKQSTSATKDACIRTVLKHIICFVFDVEQHVPREFSRQLVHWETDLWTMPWRVSLASHFTSKQSSCKSANLCAMLEWVKKIGPACVWHDLTRCKALPHNVCPSVHVHACMWACRQSHACACERDCDILITAHAPEYICACVCI